MTSASAAPTSRRLGTLGWLTWSEVVDAIGDCAAVWLGPGGRERVEHLLEVGATPVTTRIHAWSADQTLLYRLIPRGPQGIVLVTTLRAAGPNSAETGNEIAVSVTCSTDQTWRRWQVLGPAPVTFLEPAPSS